MYGSNHGPSLCSTLMSNVQHPLFASRCPPPATVCECNHTQRINARTWSLASLVRNLISLGEPLKARTDLAEARRDAGDLLRRHALAALQSDDQVPVALVRAERDHHVLQGLALP